jgi:GTP:adenosylcobinamide-phosphate guanylyltransferase
MKPLVAIAGEPMVRRPVRALLESKSIEQVIVLSQAPDRIAAVVPNDARIEFRESRGTIAETMLDLCDDPDTRWPLLVTTADHALLTPNTVDEFCKAAAHYDLAIGVVRRESLLRRLPGTQRTWLKFGGGAYTGANLFALASPKVRPAIELWRKAEQGRKAPWRVASVLGPGLLLAVLLRSLSIDEVVRRAGKRLGVRIKAVRLSNPLAGVDVDTPADHDVVEAILAGKA